VASAAINSPGIQLIRRTANELTLFVDEDVPAAIPGCERGLRAWEEIGYRGEEDKITLSPKAPSTEGAGGGTRGAAEKRGENHVP